MKVISNFNDTKLEMNEMLLKHLENDLTIDEVYSDNSHADDEIDGMKLLNHINYQFEKLYKENKKRQFLLKEVSIYLLKK